jgi:type VI protein secretion system component VasK
LPRVGAADRLRSWGQGALRNPWLIAGLVVGFLLVCAWIAWAIHVSSEHGTREALGVLVVWPAIVAVLALISVPVVWAFRVIRAGARSDEGESDAEPDLADAGEEKGAESEAAAG